MPKREVLKRLCRSPSKRETNYFRQTISRWRLPITVTSATKIVREIIKINKPENMKHLSLCVLKNFIQREYFIYFFKIGSLLIAGNKSFISAGLLHLWKEQKKTTYFYGSFFLPLHFFVLFSLSLSLHDSSFFFFYNFLLPFKFCEIQRGNKGGCEFFFPFSRRYL